MKKTLLTAAMAVLAMGSASAQVCDNFVGNIFSVMSDNGVYVAESVDGEIIVRNRLTNKEYYVHASEEDPVLSGAGNGHALSSQGTLVGYDGYNACYWLKSGLKVVLPNTEDAGSIESDASAITDDGKFIAGSLATGAESAYEGLQSFPVLWTRQSDGSYRVEKLPFPAKDFSGRDPQHVTVNDISNDGKTLVGMIVDYSGFFIYPIVYKKGEDGTWSYKVIGENIVWDGELAKQILPEPTIPSDIWFPKPEQYFTKADTIAYNNAAAEYSDKLDQVKAGLIPSDSLPVYPLKWMYVSENKAKWQADSLLYEQQCKQYYVDFDAYQESFYASTKGISFLQNNFYLSRNGKYLGTTVSRELSSEADDPEMGGFGGEVVYNPVLIDLTQDSLIANVREDLTQHSTTCVTDDGTLFAASPMMDYVRNTYVIKPNAEEPVLNFYDYINQRSEAAALFLKTKYSFDVPTEVGGDGDIDGGGDGDGDFGGIDGDGDGDFGGVGGDDGFGVASAKNAINADRYFTSDYVVVPDSVITGTVFANNDGSIFLSFMQEEYSDSINHASVNRSYVIDLNPGATSGIKALQSAPNAAAPVLRREYYNVSGQRINAAPFKGVFLEKQITANGAVTIKRVK